MPRARIALVTAVATGLLAPLLWAGAATSAPQGYSITSGSIIVTASVDGVFLSDPVELPVDGQSIHLDLAPGVEELVSLSITGSGPVSVALTPPIDGYDTLVVDSLDLTGGPGALVPIGEVPPDFEYFALIEEVVLDASFTAIDSDAPGEEEGTLAIPLGTGTGQLFVGLSGNELTLTGFAVADFLHPAFDGPITIKTDFDVAAVIPEPTGAVIFGLGLLPVSLAVRRRRTGRS